jgi:predicted 3-demethylubiquinone-9 3-methyltransferase (glyoxalase superfamily)
VFRIGRQLIECIDSWVEHPFTFTPAISSSVECERDEEIDDLFAQLSDDGTVLMPLDTYPFARRFGWLTDRFGVSWQLRLG